MDATHGELPNRGSTCKSRGGEGKQDTMNNYFVSEVHKRLCSHELVTHKKARHYTKVKQVESRLNEMTLSSFKSIIHMEQNFIAYVQMKVLFLE